MLTHLCNFPQTLHVYVYRAIHYVFIFLSKTYIVVTRLNRLDVAFLKSKNNIKAKTNEISQCFI